MAGIGIAKKGLGLLGKRKTLTVDKGAARIAEINKKLKRTPAQSKILKSDNQRSYPQQDMHEEYAQEVADIYAGKK